MSKTQENLMAAFAGESQANRKYLAFAKVADKEGLPQVAKLFRAAAAAETVHAHTHLKNAGHIGDTAANLKAALEGETYEFTKMYPGMIKDAKAEGKEAVAKYFDFANKVEEVHANLYKKAIANPAGLAKTDYYVCSVCGYTHEGPCDDCPVCGAKGAAFFKVGDGCA
ncbi:MAG: rubrerythrin family protein [Desulfovibrio sp.]|jgi:rubrerythrin|nr:rubrerythrin family protein [Desulfovibrio sp.]